MLMGWNSRSSFFGAEAKYDADENEVYSAMGGLFIQGVITSYFMKTLVFDNLTKFVKSLSKKDEPVFTRPLIANEGSLGDFDALIHNQDVFLYMITFLEPKEIYSLFSVSRRMNFLASHDYVWRTLFIKESKKVPQELTLELSWKELYRKIHTWKWEVNAAKRAPHLDTSPDGLTVSRPQPQGSNPAIMATHPFTKLKDSYEVEIKSRGAWIGVGICDRKFKIQNASTLGTQSQSINSAFFCQDSTLLQMVGCKESIYVNKKISAGDRIRVQINFEENSVSYFRNGNLEGKLVSKQPLKEEELFPCVNLSYRSVVTFINL